MASGPNTATPGPSAPGTTGSGQQDASTTIGVGGVTSGQAGATPAHETQAETGGSGGAQLTHSQGDGPAAPDSRPEAPAEADSALHSGARGALDTRPEQGGGTGTGLGSAESGANQSADDLPPG